MPVFLFTIHAYRSWNADDRRGFVRHDEGILPPNEGLAKAYDRAAVEEPAVFGQWERGLIARIAYDACHRRGWRLHAIAVEPTHVHALVSWREETRSSVVCGKLKNLVSRELNFSLSKKRRWLSRGASRKRVKDRRHFDHLIETYLPKHRGLFWGEGMPPPEPPASAAG